MLIKLDEDNAGTIHSRALREAADDIASVTGSARSTYRLARDREADEKALREWVDKRMTLDDF